MTISYAQAAARADSAMYEVRVNVICRDCGWQVPCIVHGTDVTIAGDYCDDVTAAEVERRALDIAASRRESYIEHLADGGR